MAGVNVTFGATIGPLVDAIDQAKAKIESVNESVNKISDGFKKFAEIAGAALSIEGAKVGIERMAELGLQTERTMAMLGISAEQVSLLSGVAKLTGTSMEGLSTSIERMSLNVQKSTKDAFNPAAQGLKALGLSAKDLIGLPADQYFAKLAEAVSKFNPSLNLTNAVMAVGGRGVAQMIPALMQGAEGWKHFQEEVAKTGSVLNDVQAKGFAQTHERLSLLSLSVTGLGIKIFETLKPAIDQIAESFTHWLQSIRTGDIQGAVQAVGSAMITIAQAIARFFVSLEEAVDKFAVRLDALKPKFQTIAGLTLLGTGNMAGFDLLKSALNQTSDGIAEIEVRAEASRKRIDDMAKSAREFLATMTKVRDETAVGGRGTSPSADQALRDQAAPSGLKNAPSIDMEGKGGLQAQLEYWKNAIKLQDEYYTKLKNGYEADLQLGRITETQKTQLLLQALAARERTQLADADIESKLGGLSVAQKQKIEDDKTQIAAKAALERQKIIEGEQLYNMKSWEASLGGLQSAWDSQLRGLLAGTTSWAQAMKNIAANMVIEMIREFEKLAIVKPLAQALANVTAPAEFFTSILKMIMASVGQVFAGTTANLAPALGPAAPAAAAGIASAVEGVAVGMAKLDVGTDLVMREGAAYLHSGESVVPAAQTAGPYTGGAGGPSFHFNGPIIGNQAWINQMIPQLARGMANYQRLNPSLQGA